MQRLRNATLLARFLLVWFALTLAVAVASPWAESVELTQLCSSVGSSQLPADGEGGSSGHALDCPLCVSAAPPLASVVDHASPRLAAEYSGTLPPMRVTAVAGAPLPARGPPLQGFEV